MRRHARARRPVPGRPDGDRIRRREPAAPHLGHGRAHGHHAVGRQGVEQGVEDPAAGRVIGLRHGFEPEMVRVIPLAPHADEPRLQDTNHRPVPLQQRPELGDMPQHDRLGRIPGLLPLGIAVRETHDRLAAAPRAGASKFRSTSSRHSSDSGRSMKSRRKYSSRTSERFRRRSPRRVSGESGSGVPPPANRKS